MVDMSLADDPRAKATLSADNILSFPNLMDGKLATLFAEASAPGQSHELRSEEGIRAEFRAQADSWPAPQRRQWRRPLGVAVATATCLSVATARSGRRHGLS